LGEDERGSDEGRHGHEEEVEGLRRFGGSKRGKKREKLGVFFLEERFVGGISPEVGCDDAARGRISIQAGSADDLATALMAY
jgi:hypothetical protein